MSYRCEICLHDSGYEWEKCSNCGQEYEYRFAARSDRPEDDIERVLVLSEDQKKALRLLKTDVKLGECFVVLVVPEDRSSPATALWTATATTMSFQGKAKRYHPHNAVAGALEDLAQSIRGAFPKMHGWKAPAKLCSCVGPDAGGCEVHP